MEQPKSKVNWKLSALSLWRGLGLKSCVSGGRSDPVVVTPPTAGYLLPFFRPSLAVDLTSRRTRGCEFLSVYKAGIFYHFWRLALPLEDAHGPPLAEVDGTLKGIISVNYRKLIF